MKYLVRAAAIAPLLTMGAVALAQTTTTATTTTGGATATTTPGTPNTGVGGDVAMTLLVLGASALIAVVGTLYLTRRGARGAE